MVNYLSVIKRFMVKYSERETEFKVIQKPGIGGIYQ